MNSTLSSLSFACALVWTTSALAGPAISGIAINSQTKECAEYWSGDEFTRYSLKEGWKAYYPADSDAGHGIATELGRCGYQSSDVKSCCEQLKLTFVSVDWPKTDLRGGGGGCSAAGVAGDSGPCLLLGLLLMICLVLRVEA